MEQIAANLVNNAAIIRNNNYWSPLACLVDAQEDETETTKPQPDFALTTATVNTPTNKCAAHWARKLLNRKTRRAAILDSGATSGAGPEEDEEYLIDTGLPSHKTFMFPDRRTAKATKIMLLNHNI